MIDPTARYRNYASNETDAFFHRGSRTGILLIHPITAAPDSYMLLRENLVAENYSIAIPLLRGHGTRPADLEGVSFQHWLEDLELAYQWLHEFCTQIFLIGNSLGSNLALLIAAKMPNITGIVISNPLMISHGTEAFYHELIEQKIDYIERLEPLPARTLRPLTQYDCYPTTLLPTVISLIEAVNYQLEKITAPLLIFSSEHDPIASASCANAILKKTGADMKGLILLENHSGHLHFSYPDLKQMFEITRDFLQFHSNHQGAWAECGGDYS